jgi:predicted enzyme related to lactoylglutathione lyase
MSQRTNYPPGVPCWVENLQPDTEAAARFYEKLFGWTYRGPGSMPDGSDYLVADLGGREVAGIATLPSAPGPVAPQWMTQVRVDSAQAAAERASAAGGTVLAGPLEVLPAGRLAVLADPAGAVLCAWEPEARQGAQRVNEPGAWSMSVLSTPDPEGARSFYSAVFGWETEEFEGGGEAVTLWRMPGYEGGEPAQPVSREVIAAMRAADPSSEGPARWDVDFWIADADTAAATAEANGGSVLAPPHEAPPFRRTVIADPGGAALSLSQPPR